MLLMTNDSQNFKSEENLRAFKKKGNRYLNYQETYLSVYEAKLINSMIIFMLMHWNLKNEATEVLLSM